MPKTFFYDCHILEHHLDFLGHANHTSYLVLFEEARWELVTMLGMGAQAVLEYQIGPVITDAQVRYRKEVLVREKVRIATTFHRHKSALLLTIEQKMFNAKGELACDAIYTMAYMDLKARKLVRPRPEWQDPLELEDLPFKVQEQSAGK